MTCKTISGHYDTVYSLDHNNRKFIPQNVDYSRMPRNYKCIAAGTEVYLDLEDPRCLAEFWTRYRELTELYWKDRAILKAREYEQYKERMRYLRQLSYRLRQCPEDGAGLIVFLLCLPLIVTSGILLSQQRQQLQEELDAIKEQQWLRDMEFQATKLSFRKALQEYDQIGGTRYLHHLDTVVKEMASCADDYLTTAQELSFTPKPLPRYATLEEIYDKLYEPSFCAFQEKQRPCRRYNGTYLEKIREDRHEAAKAKQQTKNAKNRKTAEAIELVIGIGDMDNTGYHNAPVDAYQSEILLKDYCDHLMQSEKVCFVTTKDLDTPGWQPPFKNGLIVLNLTVHCDEATPGIHLTCIPYSRGCKRGPEVQAALSRAMTGMGYPSTWKDVLDENGERIPKRDKYGKVIHNADGTVRYKQEADGQGIIDWIEDQKRWIQHEMEQRYGWEREYKGAHPRGNLSTPDCQVARAKERQAQFEKQIAETFDSFVMRMDEKIEQLCTTTEDVWHKTNAWEKVIRYFQMCPREEYLEYVKRAEKYIAGLPKQEQGRVRKQLQEIILAAEVKTLKQAKQSERSRQEQQR